MSKIDIYNHILNSRVNTLCAQNMKIINKNIEHTIKLKSLSRNFKTSRLATKLREYK